MESIKAVTYPVHFKDNGYARLSELVNNNSYSSIFILVDENTIELCYPKFIQNLATDKKGAIAPFLIPKFGHLQAMLNIGFNENLLPAQAKWPI